MKNKKNLQQIIEEIAEAVRLERLPVREETEKQCKEHTKPCSLNGGCWTRVEAFNQCRSKFQDIINWGYNYAVDELNQKLKQFFKGIEK